MILSILSAIQYNCISYIAIIFLLAPVIIIKNSLCTQVNNFLCYFYATVDIFILFYYIFLCLTKTIVQNDSMYDIDFYLYLVFLDKHFLFLFLNKLETFGFIYKYVLLVGRYNLVFFLLEIVYNSRQVDLVCVCVCVL